MSKEPKSGDDRDSVLRLMHTKLSQSGITPVLSKKLKLEPYNISDCKSKLNLPAAAAGFKIPYFKIDGKLSEFYRYRYLKETKTGFRKLTTAKSLRYAQPSDTINEIYLPPLYTWSDLSQDALQPLIITEGELKAICACINDYPTIGLGGVWCFKSTKKEMPLLPQFLEFNWLGRDVYICYDSDVVTNPDVMKAENALAKELTSCGASVYICRIPFQQDFKMGLDDYIMAGHSVQQLLDDALQWSASRELLRLNEEVVYIRNPGMMAVIDTGQLMRPDAFTKHAYSNRMYTETQIDKEGKTKLVEKSAANEWMKWKVRAEVQKIVYAPGKERFEDRCFNTWKGWGVQPKKGDIKPWKELLEHLFKDAPAERKWFEQWCAYPLQNPGAKLFTCVLMWGICTGTGKSLVGYTLNEIYGENGTEVEEKELHADYNGWLLNKQFVMGDEITGGDKRAVSDRMKGMITRQKLRINEKYIPSYEMVDCVNWYFTSNHPDAFFMEDDDRRNFIHEVKSRPLAREFYNHYREWFSGDGPSALFYHLLNLDMEGFDPHAPAPMTTSKVDMIENGRSDLSSWVAALKLDPENVLVLGEKKLEYNLWTAGDLLAIYDPTGQGRVTATGLSRELRRAGFRRLKNSQPIKLTHGTARLWAIKDGEEIDKKGFTEIGQMYEKERGLVPEKHLSKDRKKKF